jgi:hypothetical protein
VDSEWGIGEQPDAEHARIWRWLSEHAYEYPAGVRTDPLRPTTVRTREVTYAGVEVSAESLSGGSGDRLLGITVSYTGALYLLEDLNTSDGPARLAALLFTNRTRGCRYLFAHGGNCDLHLVFRACYRAWTAAGFTIRPMASGTYINALIVSKAKHSWYLLDWRAFTGLGDQDVDETIGAFSTPGLVQESLATRLAVAAGVYATTVRSYFGVDCAVTAGRTAIAALQRTMADSEWVWRPSALAVTLCRAGGGFRGGYCYYPPYRGPGHKLDIRRAYTWALSQELPNGTAYGQCRANGVERPGVYVCRVLGPGYVPLLVAPHTRSGGNPTRRLWNGDECYCVLPQCEFVGVRALGYQVDPGWGAVYRATTTFRPFVERIARLTNEHGAASPIGLVGKALGVRVYGKFAERPDREGLSFGAEPPSGDSLPYIDAAGEEVEDAWSTPRSAVRSHQHIDMATEITALVRSRLYGAIARLDGYGIRVLAADTDGLLVSDRPTEGLLPDQPGIGDWRYCGYDSDAIIAGPRFASIGGRVLTAGTSSQNADVVALAYNNGTVSVEGRVMAPAWSAGASARTVRRVLRRSG